MMLDTPTPIRVHPLAQGDAEALCALFDGELDAAASQALITRLCREPALAEMWLGFEASRRGFDAVKRLPATARAATNTAADEASDRAFMDRLQARLAQEPVVLAPQVARWLRQEPLEEPSASNEHRAPRAANRAWRLAAAVAGVMLVGAVAWQQLAPPVTQPEDIANTEADNATTTTAQADSVLSEDDLNEYLGAYQSTTPGTLGLVRPASLRVRDASGR